MKEQIQALLGGAQVIGRNLVWLDETASTNTYAKQLALEGAEHGTAVMADTQTAGRGRMDRSFHSPKGKGLYLSVVLRPKAPLQRLMCVTALAGVAVCDAVETVCGLRPGMKWPNDPVLGGRKICGILTELVTPPEGSPVVILGIGVNVLHTEEDFPPELRPIASSLAMEVGRPVDRLQLAAEVLRRLEETDAALNSGDWGEALHRYRRDCVHLGKRIRLMGPGGPETVTALDVDERFGLVVLKENGEKTTVRSGEISVRGLFGYTE